HAVSLRLFAEVRHHMLTHPEARVIAVAHAVPLLSVLGHQRHRDERAAVLVELGVNPHPHFGSFLPCWGFCITLRWRFGTPSGRPSAQTLGVSTAPQASQGGHAGSSGGRRSSRGTRRASACFCGSPSRHSILDRKSVA